eukprot:scaffold99903_cov58-Phaeocystis_antarctica.AAC.1
MSNAVACANRLRDAVLWVVAARVRARRVLALVNFVQGVTWRIYSWRNVILSYLQERACHSLGKGGGTGGGLVGELRARHARSSHASSSGPAGRICWGDSLGCTRRRQGLCMRGSLRRGAALPTSGKAPRALLRTMASAATAALASLAASAASRASWSSGARSRSEATRGAWRDIPSQPRRTLPNEPVGRLNLLDVHNARRGRRVGNSDSAWPQQTRPGRYAASRQYAKAHDEPGRRDPRLCAVQDDRSLPQQLQELAVRSRVLRQDEPSTRELGKVRGGKVGLEGGSQLLEALHLAQRHAHTQLAPVPPPHEEGAGRHDADEQEEEGRARHGRPDHDQVPHC